MASPGTVDEAVEQGNTRLDVLDAVIDVLAEHGRPAVTFTRLDHEARLPTGTAASLYRDTDQAVTAAAGRIVERLRQTLAVNGLLPLAPRPYDDVARLAAGGVDHLVRTARTEVMALRELRVEATQRGADRDLSDRAVLAFARSVSRAVVDAGLARTTDDVDAFFRAMADVTWAHLERNLSPGELERLVSRALLQHLMSTPNLRLVGQPMLDGAAPSTTSEHRAAASRDVG